MAHTSIALDPAIRWEERCVVRASGGHMVTYAQELAPGQTHPQTPQTCEPVQAARFQLRVTTCWVKPASGVQGNQTKRGA